ncbi:MAG: ribosome small subunit-dependent GTPase, partial [Prochlorotrichaceae cyanobacterium]
MVATQANYYRVRLDQPVPSTLLDLPPQQEWLCIRRSRLKKIGQRVMVGDRVRLEEPDWQGQRAAIVEVLERQSEMDRPPVANVNQILLMFALAEHDLDPHLLTRFLDKAESLQLSMCLG